MSPTVATGSDLSYSDDILMAHGELATDIRICYSRIDFLFAKDSLQWIKLYRISQFCHGM